nr:fungal specific transcription factor [Colletotrichum truncatum]KAF6784677.1 fungal specific transcription factor [Colletotrichum truncatum]
MVSTAVLFWTNMNRFPSIHLDFTWLMAFAVPGGGVLCLELLKPTDSHISNPDRDPRPSRSAIIQQLSLLVGFLSWVKPSASNGDLCADCKVVIQHVLNRALNDPAGVHTGAIDVSDWNISTRIGYEFDLLDTFDWLRADLS